MNQTELPPKRRRRRWLIVAFVLVLVSMVSWWYWPRGDSRFVGKWKTSTPDDPFVLWNFRSNGILEKRYQTAGIVEKTTWRIEGDFVVTGRHWQAGSDHRIIPVSDWWGMTTNLVAGDDKWERLGIQHISSTDMELVFRGGHELFVLKRLTE
jgi:hypothetical protein